MPWGCLCSKEKKRPQISSPILKPDETGKHQLLPAVRRPLLGVPEKLEQRLLDPNLNELNDRSSAEANGDESSEEFPNGNGLKRDKLQQQLIQKSKLKSSNLKSTTYTRNTENDKLTRHLNNVKFAFDEPQPTTAAAKPAAPATAKTIQSEELIKFDDEASAKRAEDQVDHNGNGNYDVLPPPPPPPEVILQIVENIDESRNNDLRPPAPDVVKSSTESIPYIDDEQAQVLRSLNNDPNKIRNFHDARIITLTPKNVGSQVEKARGPSTPELQQLVRAKLLTNEPDVTKIRFTHSFHILASGCCDRVCQHCHLVLSLDVALRCAVCEFTCHQRCVQLQQKNAHGDEQHQQQQQQQIINSKYNSLPSHPVQQQQQTRQTTSSNLNHVNNNSIPNGGSHYQHNYPSQQYHQQQQSSPYHSIGSYQEPGSTASTLRLSYVTERILASMLPARRSSRTHAASPGIVDEHERELIEMLEQKHEKNYQIFDLESCIATVSLEKLCELCKHIDSWLGSGKEKIVVLQDREDKQRLGTAIAAYLEYQKICGSNFPQSNRTKALQSPGSDLSGRRTPTWLDLDIYSTQKFLESVAGPLRIPSHKRYIKYFSGLLSGTIKMNAASLFLRAIIVESPPCLHYRAVTVNSEWRSFIKVYEGVRCLFTSDIYVIPITTRQFIYEIKHPLRLRGDVLIRCYQIIPNNNKLHDEKELISAVQFHTCAITEKEVQFAKIELDLACNDDRFPADHKVRLCFETTPNERGTIVVFQNPLVRIEPIIEGGDHLESINEDESSHTHGPLDGSLYATILKSPKSPTGSGGPPQTLISPPAEFSNGKSIPNGHHVPPVTPPPRSSSSASYSNYESAKRGYQSATTTTTTTAATSYNSNKSATSSAVNGSAYQQQQQGYQQGSRGQVVSESANISHSESSGNIVSSSSAGNYRHVIENGNSSAFDQNQNPLNQSQQQQQQQQTHTQIRSQADGRESVRSPLTLSMDSGISSSGPVNRRLQGSSVSPSSFPSQASPQDDRHRELDDLLTDMLMTVQGIPDVGRSKTTSTTPSAQTTHHHHHHHHHLHHQQHQQQQQQQQASDHFVNTNTDTIKRSYSAQLPALRETAKERELLLYETSSTTTTLTPPPSESGRETPLLSSAYSTIRDKRDLCLTPTERELIMNLQHQSFGYPRQARSTTGASERFTSDDDDDHYNGNQKQQQIPYHAREDSRPFTYGSIPLTGTPQNPPASTMLKMQSGLSSPSMVRKALGTPTSARKSTGVGGGGSSGASYGGIGRNSEFEEMLRERREKVFSEKYTIGDQSPRGTDTVDNRWNYSTTIRTVEQQQGDTNGYPHPPEPLKRSNTMDGSFGRQFSHDGISGQTWLQLQQQKLRARKEQQKREHSNSFSYSYGSPAFPTNAAETPYSTSTTHRRSQTLSPVRNERSYHTLTTTHTRTNSTERPFVAIKRAHENAKMQTIGSAPLSVLNASPHGHIAQAQQQPSQATTATAPSPSPSAASTTVAVDHHQQQQQQQLYSTIGSSNASSPINNGHHHQHHHHHEQHNVSFNNSVASQNQVQNGLLSLADHDHSTPKHGHVRLESEQLIFSNIDSLNNLDTSEKLNNLLKDITYSAAAVQRAAKSNGHAPSTTPSANNVVTSTSNNPSAATSNTFATTTTTTTINHKHHHQQQQQQQPNHPRLINHTHSNHYHHGHRRPIPEPMDISPTGGNECLRIGEDPVAPLTSSGQLALDKLLASLALENDVTEQHLANIEQQQQLSAVIANLTEYNLSEAQRLNGYNGSDLGGDAFRTHADIVNGNGFHHSGHHHQMNGRTTDPSSLLINNHVRRIASESDSTISSISPSLSERSNAISWCDQAREESFSSYRSETEPDNSPAGGSPRPETPAFPVTPRTPYGLSNGTSSPALPPKSPTSQRKDLFTGNQRPQQEIINQNETVSCYTSRRNSTTSNANSEPQEVAPQFVKFARDSSKYWYKPNISREEAITLLRNAPPGTFVVRDSTTFANAYGLVVKVAHPPPGVQSKGPNSEELVRHFLVEPTIRGVRLKGCSNEPVFTSLSALVYQHSITPLALPCRLIIPDLDLQQTDFQSPAQQQLLTQGAACNVLYLFTCDTESLTGPQAIRKAVGLLLSLRPLPKPTQVHYKVSIQGITLTDNTRQLFFRRHYPSNNVSFCGLDPDDHRWSIPSTTGDIPSSKCIFAFVAKRSPTSADNQCHVFCELEPTQPATAIVSFANKVVLGGAGGQQPAPTRAI